MLPERDSAYLAWIRTLDCARCGTPHQSEASHCGPRGLGQKTSDYFTSPLCSRCHRLFEGREKEGDGYWGTDRNTANDVHMIYNCGTMIHWIGKKRKSEIKGCLDLLSTNLAPIKMMTILKTKLLEIKNGR